jgi:hypothetical protein
VRKESKAQAGGAETFVTGANKAYKLLVMEDGARQHTV